MKKVPPKKCSAKKHDFSRSPFRTVAEADRLFEKNIRLAYKFARMKTSTGIDFDDLLSLAMDGLFRATRSWDPKRGALSTVAWWYMGTNLKHELKKTKMQAITKQMGDVPNRQSREAPSSNRIDASIDVEIAMCGLTDIERIVLVERVVHRSKLQAIGDLVGLSKERIRRIEVGALAKCRDMLELAA